MKKKALKTFSVAIAATLAIGVTTGCNGNIANNNPSDNKNATLITVLHNTGSAASTQWWVEANKRFVESKKDEVYDTGTKGVRIDVKTADVNDQDTYAQDVIISENNVNMYRLAAEGKALQIDDIVAEFDNFIDAGIKERMKGGDGHYYSMPHYSGYANMSYNKDIFEAYNLYFAAPDATADTVVEKASKYIPYTDGEYYSDSSKWGVAKFVKDKSTKKSCGPDGEYGTPDDGLPSSLEELLVLCDKMTSNSGSKKVNPFTLSGDNKVYSFFLLDTLWASLAGADAMKSVYCDWNDSQVEVVTGYTDEDLFYAGSGIKKPTTKLVTLSDDNGYKMYDMSARYYALGIMQIVYKNGWFCQSAYSNNSTTTQWDFVYGDKNAMLQKQADQSAFLVDGSYWYTEAKSNSDNFIGKYKTRYKNDPGVSLWPAPVQLSGQVAEHGGKEPVILDILASQLYINKKIANDENHLRAVKDYVRFLYSQTELKNFTESTGFDIAMTYDYDIGKLDKYYSDTNYFVKRGTIVRPSSASTRYKSASNDYSLAWSGYVWEGATYPNGKKYRGALEAMIANYGAKDIFEATKKGKWN